MPMIIGNQLGECFFGDSNKIHIFLPALIRLGQGDIGNHIAFVTCAEVLIVSEPLGVGCAVDVVFIGQESRILAVNGQTCRLRPVKVIDIGKIGFCRADGDIGGDELRGCCAIGIAYADTIHRLNLRT